MGPLVTRQHRDKVMGYVDQGVKEGAKLVVDGRGLKLQGYENGNFMGGCLFDEVKPEMSIYKDEIFGPVLSVVRSKNFDDAIKLVNDQSNTYRAKKGGQPDRLVSELDRRAVDLVGRLVPSRDEAIEEIRVQAKNGVDCVKIAIDGIDRRPHGSLIAAFTEDETAAMVREIQRLGRKAVVDAIGREAIFTPRVPAST